MKKFWLFLVVLGTVLLLSGCLPQNNINSFGELNTTYRVKTTMYLEDQAVRITNCDIVDDYASCTFFNDGEDDGSYSARIDREDIEIFADLGPTALLLYLNDRYLKDQGDYYLLDGNDVYYFIYDVLGDQYYNTIEDFEADNPDDLYFQIYLEDGVVTKMEGYEGLEMYLLIEVYYE